MSRPLRLELAGGLYHVTSRGDGREDIYLSDADRLAWLDVFGQVCKRFNWVCHAWCQMTNHYHILIETPEANLAQGMRQLNGVYTQRFNRAELIDRVEDVYDGSMKNLDEFAEDLKASLGDHPISRTVQSTLDSFRVHFVLNLFHGVDESYQTAIRPFIENLTGNVSSHCGITNLGWVTKSDAIHKANCRSVPALLATDSEKRKAKDRVAQELEDLRVTAIGLEPPKKKSHAPARAHSADPGDHLTAQLDTLSAMFEQRRTDDYRANFEYITQRALFTMKTRRSNEFGETRIHRPHEMLDAIFAKSAHP